VARGNKPSYREQKDPRAHAERQRARIERFIEQAGAGIEFLSPEAAMNILEKANGNYREANLMAIIDPSIVQLLDYHPVRTVIRVRKVIPARKKWLIHYWSSNYGLDLTARERFREWDHEVSLLFYHASRGGDYYPRDYDYPSCLLRIVKKTALH